MIRDTHKKDVAKTAPSLSLGLPEETATLQLHPLLFSQIKLQKTHLCAATVERNQITFCELLSAQPPFLTYFFFLLVLQGHNGEPEQHASG